MKNLGFLGYPKYAVTKEGYVWSLFSCKFLSDKKMLAGYPAVTLCNDSGRKDVTTHSLVAKCFCQGYEDGLQVNHIDGDKTNNHITNLEWVTPQENTRHAMETGLRRTEVINPYRSLDEALVHTICKMLDEGARNKDISTACNVSPTAISEIKAGAHYRDISCEYDFRKVPSSNRISESKIISICEELQKQHLSTNKIAKAFGVSFGVVDRIKKRKNYTYLSNNFNW